jgi:hypothetical protein
MGILSAAECNKAPFMYEMKGALSGHRPRISRFPGLTAPGQPVTRPRRSRSADLPASPAQIDRSPGLTVPVRPVARTPRRHAPPAGARHPLQIPVSRPLHRPGGNPRMVPVSCGENISTPSASVAQESVPIPFKFFPVHILSTEFCGLSARRSSYPLPYAQLLHRSPDVTQRIPAMTAQPNHSVFSRRPSVSPEFPPRPPCPRPSLSAQPSPRPERNGSAHPLRQDALNPGFHPR